MLCCFYTLFIPIFTFIGVVIIGSRFIPKNKLLVYPLIGLSLPIFILYPSSSKIEDNYSEYTTIPTLLYLIPCSAAILWMLAIHLGNYSRKLMLLFATFFYVFFFIPAFFILPLASENAFSDFDLSMKIIAYLLIGTGSLMIIALVAYFILRKVSKYYS